MKLCLSFAIAPTGDKPCCYFAKIGISDVFISVHERTTAFWSRHTTGQGVQRGDYQETKGDQNTLTCLC